MPAMHSPFNIEQLEEALLTSDSSVLEYDIQKECHRVYRITYGITHDPEEAQCLVRQSFLTALRESGAIGDRSAFSTRICCIAVKLAIASLRSSSAAEEKHKRREGTGFVQKAIHQLPLKKRLIIILHDQAGIERKEVAKILNLREEETQILLHEARTTILRSLKTILRNFKQQEENE